MNNETKYSAEAFKCKDSPVQDLQNTSYELENDTIVRKSQRTPKKRTIKSYGSIRNRGRKRKRRPEKRKQPEKAKQPENKEQSPEKKKTLFQSEQKVKHAISLIPNGTSCILQKIKEEPQESQHSEKSINKPVKTTDGQLGLESNDHKRYERRPVHKIRYDKTGHLPAVDSRKTKPTRCKLEGCTRKTTILCMKCKVHLCVRPDTNCFQIFHVLTADRNK